MRRYWVQYRVRRTSGEIFLGEVEITREKPISGASDLSEVSTAIMNGLIENRMAQRGDGTSVGVVAWTAFESPIVLLMQ